jgi:hypothetical protein
MNHQMKTIEFPIITVLHSIDWHVKFKSSFCMGLITTWLHVGWASLYEIHKLSNDHCWIELIFKFSFQLEGKKEIIQNIQKQIYDFLT